MLGFPLLYFKGMRLIMFQLSGFYCMSSSNLRWRCLRIAAFVGPIWMLIGCWIQGLHRRAYPSDRVLTTVGSSVTNINSTRNPQKPKYVLLDFGFIRFRADLRICQEVGLSGLRCLEETPRPVSHCDCVRDAGECRDPRQQTCKAQQLPREPNTP